MSHDHGSTTSPSGSGMSAHGMMVPYLHIAGGDFLFFSVWAPTSAGALAGAAVGLFVLAVLERYVSAVRGAFGVQWRQRALKMTAASDRALALKLDPKTEESKDEVLSTQTGIQELSRDGSSDTKTASSSSNIKTASSSSNINTSTSTGRSGSRFTLVRHVVPFIAAHDIPRGVLFAVQMLLVYLLMLGVMTFQVAYIIGIVLGQGVGEILFGRIAPVDGAGH